MPRVALNQPAPDFTLRDFLGRVLKLSDFRDKKNVLLVFHRGFGWLPCALHMAQLRQDYARYLARDIQVVVVGPDDPGAFVYYWQQLSLPFIGLPDTRAGVLRLFGQKTNLFKLGREPAEILIDKAGIARYVYYGHDISDIPANDEILTMVDALSAQPDPCPGRKYSSVKIPADQHE